MFHTADYDESFDLTGKKVAVIGSGSSGVQTVAAVYPKVEKLYHWVRNPTWITAGFAQRFAGKDGANFDCEHSPATCPECRGYKNSSVLQIPKNRRKNGRGIRSSTINITKWSN